MLQLATVEALINLLVESDRYDDGEDVDLLAHGLQCAELLAASHPADPELVAAGLVHDLGHVIQPESAGTHPGVGAHLVAQLLGERVAWLVRHHVHAKQLLLETDADHRMLLSPRSVATLTQQGGETLAPAVRDRLLASPDLDALLALRRADDAAKVPDAATRPLLDWVPTLRALAAPYDRDPVR